MAAKTGEMLFHKNDRGEKFVAKMDPKKSELENQMGLMSCYPVDFIEFRKQYSSDATFVNAYTKRLEAALKEIEMLLNLPSDNPERQKAITGLRACLEKYGLKLEVRP